MALCDEVARRWETQSSFTKLAVRAAVCLCCLVAGHPLFTHYLKSCSNSVWDLKHDDTFLYLRMREWELTDVWFTEVFSVGLTSFLLFFFFFSRFTSGRKRARKNQTDSPGKIWGCDQFALGETNPDARDECFELKLTQLWGLQVTTDDCKRISSPVSMTTAQLTTFRSFCWTDRCKSAKSKT